MCIIKYNRILSSPTSIHSIADSPEPESLFLKYIDSLLLDGVIDPSGANTILLANTSPLALIWPEAVTFP